MSVIRTNAAAALLGVSSNTLRSWESRFGYPKPQRTEGGHRQFDLAEIEALRQAYAETRDIASAISVARERGAGPSTPARLRAALSAFSQEKADRLMEESMAVRSVERTVETVLLAAVQEMASADPAPRDPHLLGGRGQLPDNGPAGSCVGGPEYCFAWRYASGWLAAAQRVAPASTREQGVLIFDASRPMDMDGLYVQALELFHRRAGLRVLTLPVDLDSTRVGSALRALRPQAMVLGGCGASLETVGRLVYATRQNGGDLHVLDYRGAVSMLRELLIDATPAAPARPSVATRAS
jgi:DNA-binding transcriptional MerR regulator